MQDTVSQYHVHFEKDQTAQSGVIVMQEAIIEAVEIRLHSVSRPTNVNSSPSSNDYRTLPCRSRRV
jgi:hypothetical protein